MVANEHESMVTAVNVTKERFSSKMAPGTGEVERSGRRFKSQLCDGNLLGDVL